MAAVRSGSRVGFGWEPLADLLGEPNVGDLIEAYYAELSPLQSRVPLAPDWDEMKRREAAGAFRVWAARVGGTLAGFVSFHIFPHLNYRTTLFACDGGHFLAPAFRDNARIGYRMWRSVEPALRDIGVKVIMAHDNAARPLMPFFLSLGYEPRSVLFWKVL